MRDVGEGDRFVRERVITHLALMEGLSVWVTVLVRRLALYYIQCKCTKGKALGLISVRHFQYQCNHFYRYIFMSESSVYNKDLQSQMHRMATKLPVKKV